ncbi:MAG TPA: phage tail tape measure protein [Bosea sp. (in: a-proteobacteria)]|jgi:lambda family phage tail tape measure protein|uniref:phage tail tape measure protein n=1 Tax=Bosea sp. (in: a-proteobacteria) TaxID=1871050 RepID=UPI002E105FC0|nr:phage tail tape measure protein [Bosea sp. (in: a-proteobacteria)]
MADDDIVLSSRLSDMRSLGSLTQNLGKSAESFGKSITNAFAKGIIEGKRFEDVLRSVGRSITESLLKSALKPLQSSLSSLLGTGVKSLTGLFGGGFNLGGLGGGGGGVPVAPFAEGGVIASPAYFPLGRGLGLMGERGAEAILPLSRGADGRLGVRSTGDARRPLNVVVQVSTPDADSFRRSEAQVSAAIARAVARGGRAL